MNLSLSILKGELKTTRKSYSKGSKGQRKLRSKTFPLRSIPISSYLSSFWTAVIYFIRIYFEANKSGKNSVARGLKYSWYFELLALTPVKNLSLNEEGTFHRQ